LSVAAELPAARQEELGRKLAAEESRNGGALDPSGPLRGQYRHGKDFCTVFLLRIVHSRSAGPGRNPALIRPAEVSIII